jgi:iron-sulfur cluster assembly protein
MAMVMLTPAAIQAVKTLIASTEEQVTGLRVMVTNGGCSGHQYMMGLATETEEGDEVMDFDGLSVLVDPSSRPMLGAVTVDYVEDITGVGFRFSNPSAVSTCGCGSSFSVAGETPPAGGQGSSCSRKG